LIWKSEGLPSDDLSIENALVILQVKEEIVSVVLYLKGCNACKYAIPLACFYV
jgi:hypothetical protein